MIPVMTSLPPQQQQQRHCRFLQGCSAPTLATQATPAAALMSMGTTACLGRVMAIRVPLLLTTLQQLQQQQQRQPLPLPPVATRTAAVLLLMTQQQQ
jgi:hypothetical protein